MARKPNDREDLLREAKALVIRAELRVASFQEPIVVGFRSDGAASFYFGPEVVYQFNATGELRRAHLGGALFKSENRRLVRLTPTRTADSVELFRHEMTATESEEFLDAADKRLRQLREALLAQCVHIAGQVPAKADVVAQTRGWLEKRLGAIPLAESPRLR